VFLCARMRGRRLVPNRRRMFAHDAATLAADAALHPDAEPSQRAKALCYLDETAGLARAREEIAAAHSCRT
jgi:hypothetical protein